MLSPQIGWSAPACAAATCPERVVGERRAEHGRRAQRRRGEAAAFIS